MAEDICGVLDRLAIERANVVGYSMGGMIAQILAARQPDRVRSLTSLMSSDGAPWIKASAPALAAMARSITCMDERESRIDRLDAPVIRARRQCEKMICAQLRIAHS